MESPWQYCAAHACACKVIEEQTLWGRKVCRVWLRDRNEVVTVPAEKLLELLYDLQASESDPDLKVLVFTEFTATQAMLSDFFGGRGIECVAIHGGMDMDERRASQRIFAEKARVLISTEAGGEGLNLQFCHVVVNYDLPWNPMRVEQRIGRVDRIGQKSDVLAVNLMIRETVEFRVREVLEAKLRIVKEEMGIDKLGDVLDSAENNRMFDHVFTDALTHPERVEQDVDDVARRVREQFREAREYASLYSIDTPVSADEARTYVNHPFPFWIEQMVSHAIPERGGRIERMLDGYKILWPDGTATDQAVFSAAELEKFPTAELVTIQNSHVAELLRALGRPMDPGEIHGVTLRMGCLPRELRGVWSLWRVAARNSFCDASRVVPLFLSGQGKVFGQTAKSVWDGLIRGDFEEVASEDPLSMAESKNAAQSHFQGVYEEIVGQLRLRRELELARKDSLFTSRRRTISGIGIENIRQSRLKSLAEEERKWRDDFNRSADAIPELDMLLAVCVHGAGK